MQQLQWENPVPGRFEAEAPNGQTYVIDVVPVTTEERYWFVTVDGFPDDPFDTLDAAMQRCEQVAVVQGGL